MDPKLLVEAVERLRTYLLELQSNQDNPSLDLHWLRLRCDDTLAYAGQLQRDSIRQLQADIAEFAMQHPTLLPDDLIREVGATRE